MVVNIHWLRGNKRTCPNTIWERFTPVGSILLDIKQLLEKLCSLNAGKNSSLSLVSASSSTIKTTQRSPVEHPSGGQKPVSLSKHIRHTFSRNRSVFDFRQHFTYWPGAYLTCKNKGQHCLSCMKGNHVHSILVKKAACLCYHTRKLHHTYVQANTLPDVAAKQTVSCPRTVRPPE